MSEKNTLNKEFGLASWAIENKTSVWIMVILILFMGFSAYNSMPRESFPEIKETKIYVSTVYPGNTAEDIEKLIVDPLEDKLSTVSNVVKITSTSQEDYGMVIVEFDENIEVEQAKQKVKDELDSETSSEDWPTFNGAKVEPTVFDLNMAEEMPILNINLSGDFTVPQLKEYAELLQDEIENLEEIKKADIRGAQDKEVEVAVDIYKMMAAQLSFNDVINAVNGGNMTMSAGNLVSGGQRRTIRILGEIENPEELENFVVKTHEGIVYLKDIAVVNFRDKDKTTFAREYGENVVMLDVKKRSGKNMVAAVEQIKDIIKEAQVNTLPSNLVITMANDLSEKTVNQVDDLVNNIIFGIILVVGVLMFFLGLRNALFVGLAIPMSMFLSFVILDYLGYTMNTMILFGLIMGLGMLVDNGIVVVENVYRLMSEEGKTRMQAAKEGIGEIAFPIIISTLTTVAAFIPLGMWPGVMGEFMIYFPITLSVVLGSSLFVAIFINSMIVSKFMKVVEEDLKIKTMIILSIFLVLIGAFMLFSGEDYKGFGVLIYVFVILLWLYRFGIRKATVFFQNRILTVIENFYERVLRTMLKTGVSIAISLFTITLLIIVFILFGNSMQNGDTKFEFFPDNQPNQIITYIEYPEGTDIQKTNEVTKLIETRIFELMNTEKYLDPKGKNYLVESAVSQVGEGAGNPQTDGGSTAEMPHRGKVTLSMREYKYRNDLSSGDLMADIQNGLKGIYPGVKISVEKDAAGPPVGYPINIEIKGNNYDELIATAEKMRDFINNRNVDGVDELKIDVNKSKPSMEVVIDRKKAGELGVSASSVGQQLRTSVFGAKAGIYKEDGDDYDIYVRFNKEQRYNTSALFNQNITFKDQNTGTTKEVPISAIAKQKNTSGFSSIKHKNGKRVALLYSALTAGYTDAGVVVKEIEAEMENFDLPDGVTIDFTGQIEEQNKQQIFLVSAFVIGLGLIFLILIYQFNSISKPTIIMLAIFLSFIGVFGGILITGAPFVLMMTMMGIISLAGIVVNNGVVLLDYTQLLIDRKKHELGLSKDEPLGAIEVFEAVVRGGKARLRPVLLTAITTILGLIPLAIGLNINFFTLFSEFNANLYFGGDNVIFWGPLAKTVIYGLIVATFLTLIIVPILFLFVNKLKLWRYTRKQNKLGLE